MKNYKHPLYGTWASMLSRCENAKAPDYPRYGGRGITVCQRWHDFKLFAADVSPRPDGRSLDRIDNSGPYAPDNCRWATPVEQQRNSRHAKLLTHEGKTLSVNEWARIINGASKPKNGALTRSLIKYGVAEALALRAAKPPYGSGIISRKGRCSKTVRAISEAKRAAWEASRNNPAPPTERSKDHTI